MVPGPEAEWVWRMYEAKSDAARAIDGPMLLVVGGSGAHFGIDTNMIEERLGLPSVNFGSHGGLGIDYYLYRARKVLSAGDTVLMAIEYELFDQLDFPTDLLREVIYFHDSDYVLRQPVWAWPQFYFALTPNELITRVTAAVRTDQPLIFGRFRLSADSLDQRGNETVNKASIVDSFLHEVVLADPPVRVFQEPKAEIVQSVAAFVDWCRQHQVEVVATWPNVLRRPAYSEPPYPAFFTEFQRLYAALGVPMVGRPEDAMLDLDDMFDTAYHPNDLGRAVRTARLVDSLCAFHPCPWDADNPERVQ
ncbi:MAG: hypothetical protein CMM50_17805 [Rhodospirillaceae bacterium]|nr:hypothetical protein [Rhodospirillaceae bacterium]